MSNLQTCDVLVRIIHMHVSNTKCEIYGPTERTVTTRFNLPDARVDPSLQWTQM